MEKSVNKLPNEVAEKYSVIGGKPFKFVHPQFGSIDLNKATLPQVERMIEKGLKTLVPVKKTKKADSAET